MPTYARIVDGVVAEVAAFDRLPPFHPAIAAQWREAPAEVAEGWTFDGESFVAPPPAPPAPRRPLARLTIVDRMTDGELAVALAWFGSGDPVAVRARERWTAATEIDPTNSQTVAMFEALFGAARTAELLAE